MTAKTAQKRHRNASPQPNHVTNGATLGEFMSANVATCRASDTLERAAHLMWERDVGALPVVDETSHVIGMITDRDIAMAAYLKGQPLERIEVASAMGREVRSLDPQDSPHQAISLMRRHQLHRVPIVDSDGALRGIVTINDLARRSGPDGLGPLGGFEVTETLRAIAAPRQPDESSASSA